MNMRRRNRTEKLSDGQKIIADTVSVPLSKDEIEFIAHQVCCILPTDNQALKRGFAVYQKLTGILETLEKARGEKEQEQEGA